MRLIQMFILTLLVVLQIIGGQASKVILLVLEGLTEKLIERVATPALDSVIASGATFRFRPEFPAETIPTMAAMVTGQHSEMTGMLGDEVRDNGFKVLPTDQEFWTQNMNISTLWEINDLVEMEKESEIRTASVMWPGASLTVPNVTLQWRPKEIESLIQNSKKPNNKHKKRSSKPKNKRSHRISARDGGLESKDEEEDVLQMDVFNLEELTGSDSAAKNVSKSTVLPQRNDSKIPDPSDKKDQKPGKPERMSKCDFNKTSDREWLMWMDQVDSVVTWFGGSLQKEDLTAEKETKSNLVLFYVTQPADKIRAFGPESPEADCAVVKADQLIGHLRQTLNNYNLIDSVNLLITGLHGFVEVSADNVFDISHAYNPNSYYVFGRSPVLNIQPVDSNLGLDIYAALLQTEDAKFDLYNKHGIPDRYHYKDNTRVTDIVLVAKEGYAFSNTFFDDVKQLNARENRTKLVSNKYGFAGYDNELESMESIFVMNGPGVKSQTAQRLPMSSSQGRPTVVYAVDVFPIVLSLLDISCPPTNGSISAVKQYLAASSKSFVQVFKTAVTSTFLQKDKLPIAAVAVCVVTSLLLLIICCCACSARRRRERLLKNHAYRYSQVKNNRRLESRVDGSEVGDDDKVGLLTSAIMQEDDDFNQV